MAGWPASGLILCCRRSAVRSDFIIRLMGAKAFKQREYGKRRCVAPTTKVGVGQITYHEKDHIINKKYSTLGQASQWHWVFQHTLNNIKFSRELESQSLASKQLLRCQLCSPPLCCAALSPNGFQFLTKTQCPHSQSEWPFFNLRHFSFCLFSCITNLFQACTQKKNATAQQ